MNLPAAEAALQAGEQEYQIAIQAAVRDFVTAELGLLEQRATKLPGAELRIAAGAEVALKAGAELALRSPAASVVLEPGSVLALEKGSALIVGEPAISTRDALLTTHQVAASRLAGLGSSFETKAALIVGEPNTEYWRIAHPLGASRLADLGLSFEPGSALAVGEPNYKKGLTVPPLETIRLAGLDLSYEVGSALTVGEPSTGLGRLAQPLGASLGRFIDVDGLKLLERDVPILTSDLLSYKEPPQSFAFIKPIEHPLPKHKIVGAGDYTFDSSFYVTIGQPLEAPLHTAKPFYEVEPTKGLQFGLEQTPEYRLRYVPETVSQPPPQKLPPPKSGNFGIPAAQPGQPGGDLLALLADALRSGRAKPDEVIRLVAQVTKRLPVAEKQVELNALEVLEAAWLRVKGRQTPERFAADHGMSKATLYRRWERLRGLRLELEAWQ